MLCPRAPAVRNFGARAPASSIAPAPMLVNILSAAAAVPQATVFAARQQVSDVFLPFRS